MCTAFFPYSIPQDPSLLVDLCRQCIVFEDVTAVAACLRLVAADTDVTLLRVGHLPRILIFIMLVLTSVAV